jgi:hypothetical protein
MRGDGAVAGAFARTPLTQVCVMLPAALAIPLPQGERRKVARSINRHQ